MTRYKTYQSEDFIDVFFKNKLLCNNNVNIYNYLLSNLEKFDYLWMCIFTYSLKYFFNISNLSSINISEK